MSYVEPWGYHLMLDCAGCDPVAINSVPDIAKFTRNLVQAIDMRAYGQPHIVRFGSGDKHGYSLVQLIETSTITGHFCESTNDAFIDIFSCKPFDPERAADEVNRAFLPSHINKSYIYRVASQRV